MTDPLDDLKKALKAQQPRPRPEARAAALRAAAEAFDEKRSAAAQGTADLARPTQDRPDRRAGFRRGVLTMFSNLTQPRILMGTSALATVVIAVAITQNLPLGGSGISPAELTGAVDERTRADGARRAVRPPAQSPAPAPQTRTEAVEEQPAARRADAGDADDANAPVAEFEALADAPAETRTRDLVASPSSQAAPPLAQRQLGKIQAESSAGFLPRPMPEPFPQVVEGNTERYPQAQPNPLKLVADEPVSTFSIDVDTASYAVVRSSLNAGQMPPRNAVRVEEMINYFDYDYPAPDSREVPFATSVSVQPTPWNDGTQLLHIGIQGYDIAPAERPPLNLVFLIDTSGSMNDPRKLPLLVRSFGLLLDTLDARDTVAIVTYAGSAGLVLEPTAASDKVTILNSLDRLAAGGSTAGQAGLQQAYQVAGRMAQEGAVSRVILATDGDFNVGLSDPGALKDFVAERREDGTYLSVLGFGRGNYDDAITQALAQNGNGTAAYIDTLAEAQKVLVEDMTGALFPIADDVKIQIEFNPAQVSEYRLIGYETRALNREDFNDDTVDAGEIGAGHTVTALYEITPVGSSAERIGGLRYQSEPQPVVDDGAEYAFLKLRYKLPGEETSKLIETPVLPDRQDIAPEETRFAAAVAGFGRLLRGETLPGWSWDEARELAAANRGDDPYGYRSELLSLIRMADALE
ncbi:DUF3520 domain-containing protein [Rhodobacteraceae bacterium 2CG4]|uniref:DUF3520 domain-containing protein n=1 Tax=Halovulum marinum TaxID=2662447 RepID=A0A6L5Z2U6_9RHOB|nr:VWA domain-containing protein [Halovulum marinum]MSU90400.1 DUF3520 domain-containing protein [Halovulum marinum]